MNEIIENKLAYINNSYRSHLGQFNFLSGVQPPHLEYDGTKKRIFFKEGDGYNVGYKSQYMMSLESSAGKNPSYKITSQNEYNSDKSTNANVSLVVKCKELEYALTFRSTISHYDNDEDDNYEKHSISFSIMSPIKHIDLCYKMFQRIPNVNIAGENGETKLSFGKGETGYCEFVVDGYICHDNIEKIADNNDDYISYFTSSFQISALFLDVLCKTYVEYTLVDEYIKNIKSFKIGDSLKTEDMKLCERLSVLNKEIMGSDDKGAIKHKVKERSEVKEKINKKNFETIYNVVVKTFTPFYENSGTCIPKLNEESCFKSDDGKVEGLKITNNRNFRYESNDHGLDVTIKGQFYSLGNDSYEVNYHLNFTKDKCDILSIKLIFHCFIFKHIVEQQLSFCGENFESTQDLNGIDCGVNRGGISGHNYHLNIEKFINNGSSLQTKCAFVNPYANDFEYVNVGFKWKLDELKNVFKEFLSQKIMNETGIDGGGDDENGDGHYDERFQPSSKKRKTQLRICHSGCGNSIIHKQ